MTYRSDDDALRARITQEERALGEAEAAAAARAEELARCHALKADLDAAIPRRSGLALDAMGYVRLSALMATAAALGVVGQIVRGYSFWGSIAVMVGGSVMMIAMAELNNRRKKRVAASLKDHHERMTREAAERSSERARLRARAQVVAQDDEGELEDARGEASAVRRERS